MKQNILVILVIVISVILLGLVAITAFLDEQSHLSGTLGSISIIMSILLSLVATWYTYKSGQKTLDLLEDIKNLNKTIAEQNDKLAEKIVQDSIKNGLGARSLEAAKEYGRDKFG